MEYLARENSDFAKLDWDRRFELAALFDEFSARRWQQRKWMTDIVSRAAGIGSLIMSLFAVWLATRK